MNSNIMINMWNWTFAQICFVADSKSASMGNGGNSSRAVLYHFLDDGSARDTEHNDEHADLDVCAVM